MHTRLAAEFADMPEAREAEAILKSCVHCGFCTATCPTYRLFNDELEGPRGRIYLIKSVLEGEAVSEKTVTHLDRCLGCRSCETTCPSGVRYHRLLDIGRTIVSDKVPRRGADALTRAALKTVVPRRGLFSALLFIGRAVRRVLPEALARHIPATAQGPAAVPRPRSKGTQGRRVLALAGCVQPALGPNINAAAARVLAAMGIEMVEARGAGCCGALRHHLDDRAAAVADMKRNIDAWWPWLEPGAEAGVEALVMTASGCGMHVKEYGELLRHDPVYADKAARVAALTQDIGEFLAREQGALAKLFAGTGAAKGKVAFHSPCSLQHGQGVRGTVESLLGAAGYQLTGVADAHLCCGSAGSYSLLQPDIALRLRTDKLAALSAEEPELIATANIGCLAHLQAGSRIPVRHWIELVDARISGAGPG